MWSALFMEKWMPQPQRLLPEWTRLRYRCCTLQLPYPQERRPLLVRVKRRGIQGKWPLQSDLWSHEVPCIWDHLRPWWRRPLLEQSQASVWNRGQLFDWKRAWNSQAARRRAPSRDPGGGAARVGHDMRLGDGSNSGVAFPYNRSACWGSMFSEMCWSHSLSIGRWKELSTYSS